MPTTYSPERKADILSIFTEVGLAETVRRTGAPKKTIADWAKAAGLHSPGAAQTAAARQVELDARADRAKLRREELRLEMLDKASDLLHRMDQPYIAAVASGAIVTLPMPPAPAVQNFAISFGIMVDKFRLEMGDATSRTETRSLTDALDDHEAEVLGEVIRGELARRKDGDAAIPAMAGDAASGAEAPTG